MIGANRSPPAWRRFVVQHHLIDPDSHWDLMFEDGAALATWRCACPLADVRSMPVPLTRLADHRSAYLDYEGPVSGDRGRVEIDEAGRYCMLGRTEQEWILQVEGARSRGTFQLRHVGPRPADWTVLKLA